LVQEIRALALGHLAAEPRGEDFLLVDFGQGVGGAIVQRGKLFDSTLPLSGELGHTMVIGNSRHCGCGAVGCVETLVSRRGLLQSFVASGVGAPATWPAFSRYLAENPLPSWLENSLDAASAIIAGALNVLGLKRAVITGSLTELPPGVIEHLAKGVKQGSMWARFGEVACQSAQRRRAMGLVGVGVDRLLIPDTTRHRFAQAGINGSNQIASFRK
jgi:predicted NBD/HSP70 family sugar kinase